MGWRSCPMPSRWFWRLLARILILRLAWADGFRAGNAATQAIRNRILDTLRILPLDAIKRWSAARLAILITEDGRWINEAGTFLLSRLLGGLAAGFCLVVAAAAFDATIALATVTAFGAGLVTLPFARRRVASLLAARTVELTALNQRIGEYGEGIAVFRSFCAGHLAYERLMAAAASLCRLMKADLVRLVALQGLAATLMNLAIPMALIAIALLVRPDGPAQRELIPALLLGLAASHALANAVLPHAMPLELARQAQAHIARFLAEPPLRDTGASPGQPLDLALEGVGFSYRPDEPPALSEVDISVPAGKTIAIVGPSGAGKSTIAALAMRFFDPQSGTLRAGRRRTHHHRARSPAVADRAGQSGHPPLPRHAARQHPAGRSRRQ